MVDRKGARHIRIHHVHNPLTPQARRESFDNAVKRVMQRSDFSPQEKKTRIENLKSAHGLAFAQNGEIFSNCNTK